MTRRVDGILVGSSDHLALNKLSSVDTMGALGGVMQLSDQSRIAGTADQVSCNLDGDAAILNLKNGVYYGLNPVGARLWALVQASRTFAEIRDTLLAEYEVDATQLDADLRTLLAQLVEQGLVEIKA